MKPDSIAVVLNAASGHGGGAEAADRLRQIFASAGRETDITLATSGAELSRAAEAAVKRGYGTLVAGGGDGTINTAAAAVIGREVTLGVLPLGTLNHFAKDLGIPIELEAAAGVVLNGRVGTVDVGEVNGRVFLNNSSLGLYPAIVRLRERYQETGRGKWIAALWASLIVLRRHPFMAVRITAGDQAIVRRTPFVFVGNNEYQMAGLEAGSRETIATGRLAVYVMNAERRRGLLRLAWDVFRQGVEPVKELDLLTVEEATIETRNRRLPVALDGEVVPLHSPLHYRIRPGALRVHVPERSSACYPPPAGPSSTRSL
jgi:diacylglycerol kinase family enzyme